MKNILTFFLTLILITGCNIDDDNDKFHPEILPIETINLPASFNLNQIYTIDFTFIRPTSCHTYDNIFITAANQENRTIAVNAIVLENLNCQPLTTNNIIAQSFDFKVIYDQVYTFHIWKGKDSQGNDIYDDIDIPVN